MMATLAQLLAKTDFQTIFAFLKQYYGFDQQEYAKYRRVFGILTKTVPEIHNLYTIDIKKVFDDQGDTFIDVVGRPCNIDSYQLGVKFSLEFTSWQIWLGTTVWPKLIEQMDEAEIIAHCLVEMTISGIDQQIVEQAIKNFENYCDKIAAEFEQTQKILERDPLFCPLKNKFN